MKIKFQLGILVALFFVCGCAIRLVDFTIISTKNVDLSNGANFKRAQSRVEGTDSVSIIIFIPIGMPNMKEAIDKAIESVPGAIALLDGVVTYKWWYIPYIFGKSMYIVEGTPLIDPELASEKLQSNYIISRLDKKGTVMELKYVDKSEYDTIKKKVGI